MYVRKTQIILKTILKYHPEAATMLNRQKIPHLSTHHCKLYLFLIFIYIA